MPQPAPRSRPFSSVPHASSARRARCVPCSSSCAVWPRVPVCPGVAEEMVTDEERMPHPAPRSRPFSSASHASQRARRARAAPRPCVPLVVCPSGRACARLTGRRRGDGHKRGADAAASPSITPISSVPHASSARRARCVPVPIVCARLAGRVPVWPACARLAGRVPSGRASQRRWSQTRSGCRIQPLDHAHPLCSARSQHASCPFARVWPRVAETCVRGRVIRPRGEGPGRPRVRGRPGSPANPR